MNKTLNKLLARQIKKHFGSADQYPAALSGFLTDINDSYNDFEDEAALTKNMIEISSQELRDAYENQKQNAEKHMETVTKIKEAINALNSKSNKLVDSDHNSLDSNYLFNSLLNLIEERKQSEIELTKLKVAVEQSSSTVVITSLTGKIQYVNQKFIKTTGYSYQEAMGANPRILKSNEMPNGWYKELWDTISSGNEWRGEFHNKRKDGTLYWEFASISPIFDGNGEITSFLAVKDDITERKITEQRLQESELRFAVAIEGTNAGIWDWDMQKNEVAYSLQWKKMLGYEDSEIENVFDGWKKLWHPDDVQSIEKSIHDHLNGWTEKYEVIHRCKHKDGSWRWMITRGKMLRDKDNTPYRWIGTNIDITDLKEAENNLQKAVAVAEAANKAKSEFLANMSHEIRTPLNGVIGFTDLLKSTPLSPVQQQYVVSANVSGRTLLGIINDILDFSKIEAGMMDLEIINTDLIELLGQSVDIIKYSAEKKGLEVLLNIDSETPRFAAVDQIRLKQVFTNLLGNAVKFTQNGEIELKVSYKDLGNSQGKFSFSVRDTGIGINEEQQSKLFKVFSQADSSTTRKFGGTGLGLVISQMIVNKMGSQISITSNQGEGSIFYFDIVTTVQQGEKIDTFNIQSIKRCLVIDDNENNRTILEHTLTNWGIECISVDNGLTALKTIGSANEQFDVVICDYHMPYMDGLDTIKMIREMLVFSPEQLPIILLHSSSDDAELHKRCKELGVKFQLNKPVKTEDLYSYLCSIQTPNTDVVVENSPEQNSEPKKELSVLVAEDVDMNMLLIKYLLEKSYPEIRILEAVDGIEAVARWQNENPNLILMDMQMPEMDGIEATLKIRELEAGTKNRTPIIALTAGAMQSERDKCFEAGMDDFLTKPIEQEKLIQAINRFIK